MTVLDLIEILQLNKGNNIFTPLPSGSYFKTHSVFDVSSKKIIFHKELTLSEFYDSKKDISYDLITYIQKNVGSVYNNERELLRYFSVFQLLIAIDQASGNENCASYDKYLETAKQYVTKINQTIIENYQTDDIQDMQKLIYILSNTSLYRELFFHVQVFDYNNRRPCPNKKSKNFSFGNKRFHNELDKVHITIYNDYVELWHPIEGRSHARELSPNRTLSLEQKIIAALDCWQTYYKN
mgnify:FL=1